MLRITAGSKKQPTRAALTMSDENCVPGGKVVEILSGSEGVASLHRRLRGPWRPCPFRKVSSRQAIKPQVSANTGRESDDPIVAMKRVTIVEPRGSRRVVYQSRNI